MSWIWSIRYCILKLSLILMLMMVKIFWSQSKIKKVNDELKRWKWLCRVFVCKAKDQYYLVLFLFVFIVVVCCCLTLVNLLLKIIRENICVFWYVCLSLSMSSFIQVLAANLRFVERYRWCYIGFAIVFSNYCSGVLLAYLILS